MSALIYMYGRAKRFLIHLNIFPFTNLQTTLDKVFPLNELCTPIQKLWTRGKYLVCITNTAFVYGNMIYFWLEKQQKAQTKWQSGILYKDEDRFCTRKAHSPTALGWNTKKIHVKSASRSLFLKIHHQRQKRIEDTDIFVIQVNVLSLSSLCFVLNSRVSSAQTSCKHQLLFLVCVCVCVCVCVKHVDWLCVT